jgi:hypothetical protein
MRNFTPFIEVAQRWNIPMWLGETGENNPDWTSAVSQICEEHHISYHFWPYKKMEAQKKNSSVSIVPPEGWGEITAYADKGGKSPGHERAENILTEFLKNMLLENCIKRENVDRAILRNGEFILRATEYAERAGSYKGHPKRDNVFDFRINRDIEIVEIHPKQTKRFFFDNQWDRFNIVLTEGEFVSYYAPRFTPVKVGFYGKFDTGSRIKFDGKEVALSGDKATIDLSKPSTDLLKLECVKGKIQLDRLVFM